MVEIKNFNDNCNLGIIDIFNETIGNGTFTDCQHLYAFYVRILIVSIFLFCGTCVCLFYAGPMVVRTAGKGIVKELMGTGKNIAFSFKDILKSITSYPEQFKTAFLKN